MHLSEQSFLSILQSDPAQFETSMPARTTHTSHPQTMAQLYVHAAMLATFTEYLSEQLWLQKREDKTSGTETTYQAFLEPFFETELPSALFLKDFLLINGSKQIKAVNKHTSRIASHLIAGVMACSSDTQKAFLIESFGQMSKRFLYEESLQAHHPQSEGHLGPCLYRTFDDVDELFDLRYELDRDMEKGDQKERLYPGSGANVQSGYSTILLALHHLDLQTGSKVIDLGSGFGKVGLVCSLLHPDVEFIGYEYVSHRVDVSNEASQFLDLGQNLQFITQDLSLPSFQLPVADVYYLYDPFTKETYQTILEQIVDVSQTQPVTVVTKGNARKWLLELAEENNWPAPILIDEGNLALFSSAASSQPN